jgi:hypothetical protein
MKPSKFITVKGRKAWFLLPGFSALTWKGYAYCKSQKEADKINSTDKIDSRLESHETIHIRQAESTHDSWFLFYTRYVWEYICNLPLIFINIYAPYKFMPFEIEAYLNQDEWYYCMHGATYQWKDFEEMGIKARYKLAKKYYTSIFRPYITYFLKNELMRDSK